MLQLPGSAREAKIEGIDQPVASGPDGANQVLAAYVQLDRNAVAERTISFVMPPRVDAVQIEPSARIPGVGWTYTGVQWIDKKPRIVTW